ncbi:GNAT family N-acetyltransferase [Elizabethkingia sp. JS20170427COW]|uniref:GNAT family N-acetyltransferase n=1 Tax=Elizabethkingia sp. JS20170427COW TaxID=2583851 RepID=UPI0011107B95|nr:GNAT family N-acetyltransferase [Elizabethkingia sp. JS20170427COW]QCX53078.1 GNAT family N-acetyltransferase [Elizabethkingia sp. JS20170427COW]
MDTTPIWKVKTFNELTTEELYQLIRLRIEIFILEQEAPYQDCDNYDQQALHIWAEIDGEVAAYCRMFDKGIKYPEASIGRVISNSKFRGTGLGKKLISLALETMKNKYANPDIRISAQNYLLPFYGSFGFIPEGETYLEDNLPHTEMFRKA